MCFRFRPDIGNILTQETKIDLDSGKKWGQKLFETKNYEKSTELSLTLIFSLILLCLAPQRQLHSLVWFFFCRWHPKCTKSRAPPRAETICFPWFREKLNFLYTENSWSSPNLIRCIFLDVLNQFWTKNVQVLYFWNFASHGIKNLAKNFFCT